MKKIKTILIDDEQDSCEILNNFLTKYCPQIEVVDVCNNIIEGYSSIEKNNPELVFLDIEMPFGNGFDLLDKFNEIPFQVIFVTAYSQYAIQALNRSAAYYILKPIDIDELIEAVEKVEKNLEKNDSLDIVDVVLKNLQQSNGQNQKLVLPNLTGFDLVEVNRILRCEAMDNYTNIFMEDGKKFIISKTLKHFELLLQDCDFMRVHKSHIINLKKVTQYIKGKTPQLILKDGSDVDLSPGKKQAFLERFK